MHRPLPAPTPLGARWLLALLAALLATGLGGCSYIPWLGGGKDPTPPTDLEDFVQEVGLKILWSDRLTKGSGGRRLDLVPAVGGGRVLIADSRGRVLAADLDNGRVLWEQKTDLPFSGGPDLDGDRIYLGTSGGQVVALSATDGREIWRAQLDSEVLSVPRVAGEGTVIVHTLDDTVYGLNRTNGAEKWKIAYPAPILTLRGSSSPSVTPTGVVVGLSGGKLVKFDPADGTPLWEVTVTPPRGRSELARISDIDADPVAVGTLVFVGTYNGDLAAVDLDSGTILWRRQLSSYAGLAATETDLYITDSEDQIWAADPVSGAGRWKQERLRYRQLTAPALIGNLIAVGDLDGYVHLIAQKDGRLVGRTRISRKGAIDTRPVVAGNRLVVYANDGTLAVLTTGSAPAPSGKALKNQAAEGGAKAAIPATGGSALSPAGGIGQPAP
jgi:outer membrane protein assembly factor BamB